MFTFLIYRGVRRLLRLAKDTLENIRDLTDTAVEQVARPLADTASAWSQIGSIVGFLTGISGRRRRRQRERDRDSGREKRDRDRNGRRRDRDGDRD